MQRYFKRIAGVVMNITFIIGNPRDCLMKEIILLKHLIMELIHT